MRAIFDMLGKRRKKRGERLTDSVGRKIAQGEKHERDGGAKCAAGAKRS